MMNSGLKPRYLSGTETVSKLFVDAITVALEARETLCDSKTQGTNSNLILGATFLRTDTTIEIESNLHNHTIHFVEVITKMSFDERWDLFDKGLDLLTLGKWAEAEETLKKLTTIDPDTYANWIALGRCQLAQQKLEAAEISARKAIELSDKVAQN